MGVQLKLQPDIYFVNHASSVPPMTHPISLAYSSQIITPILFDPAQYLNMQVLGVTASTGAPATSAEALMPVQNPLLEGQVTVH